MSQAIIRTCIVLLCGAVGYIWLTHVYLLPRNEYNKVTHMRTHTHMHVLSLRVQSRSSHACMHDEIASCSADGAYMCVCVLCCVAPPVHQLDPHHPVVCHTQPHAHPAPAPPASVRLAGLHHARDIHLPVPHMDEDTDT